MKTLRPLLGVIIGTLLFSNTVLAWNTGHHTNNNEAGSLLLHVSNNSISFNQDLNIYTSDLLLGNIKKPITIKIANKGFAFLNEPNTSKLQYFIIGANMDKTTPEFKKTDYPQWRSNRGMIVSAETKPNTENLLNSIISNTIRNSFDNINFALERSEKISNNLYGTFFNENRDIYSSSFYLLKQTYGLETFYHKFDQSIPLFAIQYLHKKSPAPYSGDNNYAVRKIANVSISNNYLTITPTEVPVPSSIILFGSAILGLLKLKK